MPDDTVHRGASRPTGRDLMMTIGRETLKAWEWELRRHDWAALRCGCGRGAAHLPATFGRLLGATAPDQAVGHTLTGHLEEQSMLFEAAPHAVPVILAGLAERPPDFVRGPLLSTLGYLVTGESHRSEAAAGRPGLEEECAESVREGLWQLYAEAATGHTEAALDILEHVDPDEERFAFHRARCAGRLRK
ncbi:hypothetical protein [Streptomyces sp. BE230]|uniref:hypothetical protein n=1 Tax=Streptomyces sp. BE230 TaxID=3002526 RepID=UPI002ED1C1F3|nr:hypothetical protein [Streptomyces sp. BE230]